MLLLLRFLINNFFVLGEFMPAPAGDDRRRQALRPPRTEFKNLGEAWESFDEGMKDRFRLMAGVALALVAREEGKKASISKVEFSTEDLLELWQEKLQRDSQLITTEYHKLKELRIIAVSDDGRKVSISPITVMQYVAYTRNNAEEQRKFAQVCAVVVPKK